MIDLKYSVKFILHFLQFFLTCIIGKITVKSELRKNFSVKMSVPVVTPHPA